MDLESNPEEKVVMVEHQEFPKEEATVEAITDMGAGIKAMVGAGRSWLLPADV
jgi:hypothetical protein